MLLKSSLVAILFRVSLIYASSPGGDKKSSPLLSERSISSRPSSQHASLSSGSSPMNSSMSSHMQKRASNEIRIPLTDAHNQSHEEMFPVPLHVQERRQASRVQNGEFGIASSSFRASGNTVDSFVNYSPPDASSCSTSLNHSMVPLLQSLITSSKGSFTTDQPCPYPKAYSYHAVTSSNYQGSSDDALLLEEPRENRLTAAKLSLVIPDESTSKPAEETLHSKRCRKSKAVPKGEKDEQPSDRRVVTLDLFKSHSANADNSASKLATHSGRSSSNVTPNASASRKGVLSDSKDKDKDEKKATYLSALSEALLLKPEPPQAEPLPIAQVPVTAAPDESPQAYLPVALPFDEWSLLFRLPSSMLPYNAKGPFSYPRCEQTDPVFEQQLRDFRTSLITRNGTALDLKYARDYIPFPDPGRPLDDQLPNRPVPVRPFKIFESQPKITWVYVECSVLGFDFQVIEEYQGREANAGRKSNIQFVKYGQTRYVRKIYNSLEFFMNELQFLQKVHHDLIPRPICVEKNFPAIVMEYVPGKQLHRAMHESVVRHYDELRGQARDDSDLPEEFSVNPLLRMKNVNITFSKAELNDLGRAWRRTWNLLVKILLKLMSLIKYIHNLGLIHSDIKPENIIFDSDSGRIVLLDFDLSTSAPFVYSNRGTATTVAPEVTGFLKGPVHYAADWWGFASTAAMVSANAIASYYHCLGETKTEHALANYVPFVYNYSEMAYTMNPIPFEFPEVLREFLYPFFSPIPAHRMFSEQGAFEWITSHPFFHPAKHMKNFDVIRNPPSFVSEVVKFSQNPFVLTKTPHRKRDYKQSMEMLRRIAKQIKQRTKEEEEEEGEEGENRDSEPGVFDFEDEGDESDDVDED